LPDIAASAATGAADVAMFGTLSAAPLAPAAGPLIRLGADTWSSRQRCGSRVVEVVAE
jgi:hypothetical protein